MAQAGRPSPFEGNADGWDVMVQMVYCPRSIDGTIQYDRGGPGEYLATTQTLGLDTVGSIQYLLAVKHKRWTMGVNYAPVAFSGRGYGYGMIGNGDIGVVGKINIDTHIDVDLLLGNVLYDLIRERYLTLAVGAGMGASMIDVALTPRIASDRGLTYNDTTPFGFLSVSMQTNYRRFFFGVNINGIDLSTEPLDLGYLDLTINLGCNLIAGPVRLNVLAGFRQVQFEMETRYAGETVVTDVDLTGPFIGLNAVF